MTPPSANSSEKLWNQFAADLRRFLRSRLPGDEAADDLLQEAFLRVHRRQGDLRDSLSAKGWIYQIARNLIIDYYRNEAKLPVVDVEPQSENPADLELEFGEIRQRIGGWLSGALAELPETYREATRLAAQDGLSQQEVADRLNVSLEAAKSRIRRGRAQLKRSLLECCSLETDRRGNVIDYEPNRAGSCCHESDVDC